MEYIFGPVLSRRLGLSLGVDLLPHKTCNLDCVYCEIGRTASLTCKRGILAPEEKVLREIASCSGDEFDHLTFAGSGEPTLSASLGRCIRRAHELTEKPVAVITNSTLLTDPLVREEVAAADLVLPSLDAATEPTFQKINCPPPTIRIADVIDGLCRFREEFDGEMWLEVMLVKDYNQEEAPLIAKAAEEIGPDRIQLNTVVRPPSEPVLPLSREEMLEMLDIFPGAEVIPDWDWQVPELMKAELLELLYTRPRQVDEIGELLGLKIDDLMKYLNILEGEGLLGRRMQKGSLYFVAPRRDNRGFSNEL